MLHIFSLVLERKDCIMSTSGAACALKSIKCRKSIMLEIKLEILRKNDEGMQLRDIVNLFNLALLTVVTIKKDKDRIK